MVLDGFVNLDNSPFLWLADLAPWVGNFLARKHRDVINDFRNAKKRAPIRRRDCRRPLPYESGEVDHILCSHFLEYLPKPEMQDVLRDFHRVLRTGGTVHVILPDLARMTRRYVEGEIDADQFQQELMLHPEEGESFTVRLLQLWDGFALTHRWMYDPASAAARMEEAGFVIESIDTPSSFFRVDDGHSLHLVGVKKHSSTAPPDLPTG